MSNIPPTLEQTHGSPYHTDEINCSICCTPFNTDATFTHASNVDNTTACKHSFHVSCLEAWLLTSNICPYCRGLVRPAPVPPSTPAAIANAWHAPSALILADDLGDIWHNMAWYREAVENIIDVEEFVQGQVDDAIAAREENRISYYELSQRSDVQMTERAQNVAYFWHWVIGVRNWLRLDLEHAANDVLILPDLTCVNFHVLNNLRALSRHIGNARYAELVNYGPMEIHVSLDDRMIRRIQDCLRIVGSNPLLISCSTSKYWGVFNLDGEVYILPWPAGDVGVRAGARRGLREVEGG